MRLDGSVALVTGGSRGLGLAVAELLAQRGARLVIAARNGDALEAARRELARATDVVAVTADVSEDAERVVAAALETFGRVDILMNNASELGPSPLPALERLGWQAMERILCVNVTAPLHLIQLVLPHMRAQGQGAIVNVTSDAGVNAYPTWGGYGASKAALEHLSRVLAAELEGSGVQVFVVDPGDMNTRMHQDAEPGVDLCNLPPPSVSAKAIIDLLERERAAFGRFEAQKMIPVAR